MKNPTETPKETETDVKKLAEKLEEIDSAEGIFGEVITDEELDLVGGGGGAFTCPAGLFIKIISMR